MRARPRPTTTRDCRPCEPYPKAQKITAIIGLPRFLHCQRILEIGCGSGLIASTLAATGNPELSVNAVDVVDSRVEKNGYRFNLVDGTALPFANGTFDLVITNHVIEHVGQEPAQLAHLEEVKRVMSDDGVAYFAVPNKWRIVELNRPGFSGGCLV